MTHKAVLFVVCHTLPEILRVSPSTIHKLGTEFCLCDCRRCGQSVVIGVDEAKNVATLDVEIVCAMCAATLMPAFSKPN